MFFSIIWTIISISLFVYSMDIVNKTNLEITSIKLSLSKIEDMLKMSNKGKRLKQKKR